ncbi:hypothetical protein GCM10010329_65760 [Streptomyces spiroverticillatus]|uniref:Uncharacterized protein n=1 Tax=Streptomyces finlayi TaxID=67296 RepID=A0A918X4I6_9ACTN|nr:hypothetical protein GCM10010329_65760 [Streptomyces spiroverticillatus]GHD11341.1 hypothetical protein GCM10010334_67310 [Streptomyces finlayi]
MPKTGGFPAGFHSKVVRKLPSLPEMAITARKVRKAAMDAMTTSSRMPEPRESPRKILSPGRVALFASVAGGGGGEGGESGGMTVVVMMDLSGLGGRARGLSRAAVHRMERVERVERVDRDVVRGRGRPGYRRAAPGPGRATSGRR